MNFGRELKEQRAMAGLSQSKAAALFLDMSVRTWQVWEQGYHSPPLWAQHMILDRLSRVKPRKRRKPNVQDMPSRQSTKGE